MRRSSAPSQLHKRQNSFLPPYKCEDAKKFCSALPSDTRPSESYGNQEVETVIKNDLQEPRTSADLLNLIKMKPASLHTNEAKSPNNLNENSSSEGSYVSPHSPNHPIRPSFRHNMKSQEKTNHNFASDNSLYVTSNSDINSFADRPRYYSVVWCKFSRKKHKIWEGDAVLIIRGRTVALKDMEGKEIARSSGYKLKDLENLEEGNTLPIGGKEVEIQGQIIEEDYMSGRCFSENICIPLKDSSNLIQNTNTKPRSKPFRLPTKKSISDQTLQHAPKVVIDSSHPDAIVMPRPPSSHQWLHNTQSLPVTDVVIAPFLGAQLRPHQQTGILFLYECVMGFRMKEYQGAILADEMGLGKTLQCIALIWTLIKQGPYGYLPVLRRVLIVTPSSIASNWGKEFDKWLGKERIKPFIVNQQHKVENFVAQEVSPILIISYEMLVRNIDKIGSLTFDLLLCDEGHRLKNGNIKTSSLIAGLNIKRRIIVTGTPIQNDMQELFALVEFVNPGLLGSATMFKRIYEEPIVHSKQPRATAEEKQLGERRAMELNRITSQFTLRRTQEIINRYLPPKVEYVIFCEPAEMQSEMYRAVVGCTGLKRTLETGEVGDHLSAVCILRKLCNHPALLCVNEDKEHLSEIQNEILKFLPDEVSRNVYMEQDSGKLAVVSCILWSLAENKRERVVVVSNFTTTLNMLQQLCERYNYSFLRLDGSTPTAKRQTLIDRFNGKQCQEFVFLLSAKAGGVGVNLIGASRIILFDIDWNPATDLQAMSRIWRDGQRKTVYIYRLLLAGSIEEKIYQRQVCKQGISGSVVDARSHSKITFSLEELKDLFTFYPDVLCLTHDAMNCPCDQMGNEGQTTSPSSSQTEDRDCQLTGAADKPTLEKLTTMDQLHRWQHFSRKGTELLGDVHLESAVDFINFVFRCKTGE